jgi:hypothetical protein
MFYNNSPFELLFVGLGSICLSLLILAIVYSKKLLAMFGFSTPQPAVQTAGSPSATRKWAVTEEFPPLIDKPADHPVEQAESFEQAEEDFAFELSEAEGPATLLKEADRVVADIQDAVNSIESRPANSDEVFTKIRAIVSGYRFFQDTEYYDAINSFISVTVQRDCDLALTEEDLSALWYANAA